MNKYILSLLLITSYGYSIAQEKDSIRLANDNNRGSNETKDAVSAAATIIPGEIYNQEYSLSRLLDGQATGLLSTNGGGQPGSDAAFYIRGMHHLQGGDDHPLVTLDGMPYYGALSDLNPEDVERVEILKDAVATGRYGYLAKDGIIAVYTKKHRGGDKPAFNVSLRSGLNQRGIRDYETIQDAGQYYEITWDAIRNMAISSGFTNEQARLFASDQTVNWLGYNAFNVPAHQLLDASGKINPEAVLLYKDNLTREVQRNGLRQDYNLSYVNGSDKYHVYTGLGYVNDQGYVQSTNYQRLAARLNAGYLPINWLKIGLNAMYTHGKMHTLATEADAPGYNPFLMMRMQAPIYPVYYRNTAGDREADPFLGGEDKLDWGSRDEAPWSSMGTYPDFPNRNILGSLLLDKHLTNSNNLLLAPYLTLDLPYGFNANVSMQYNRSSQERNVSYNNIYGQYASADGRVGTDMGNITTWMWNASVGWEHSLKATHHISASVGYDYLYNETSQKSQHQNGDQTGRVNDYIDFYTRSRSLYGLLHYNFKSRYFLSGAYSQRQETNNWSVGASWNVTNESFLHQSKVVNNLLLKTSYGVFQANSPHYYLLPHTHLNAGMEASVANNRLGFSLNYFVRNSENAVYRPRLGADTSSTLVRNSGWEIALRLVLVESKNVRWAIFLNHTILKNEIIKPVPSYVTGYISQKGGSVYDFFLVESAGADQSDGSELFYYMEDGIRTMTKDYSLALRSWVNAGSALPKGTGSFGSSVSYKNWELSVLFTYSYGNKYYDSVYQRLMGPPSIGWNYAADIADRWTVENPNSNIPKIDVSSPATASTRFLTDGSYLNARRAMIGYNFSEGLLKKIRLSSLKLSLSADNIFLWTQRKGLNPQTTFDGIASHSYVAARTILVGVNIGI